MVERRPFLLPEPLPASEFIQQHERLHDHRHVHVTATYTHVLPHLSKAQDSGDWGSDNHSIVEGPCATPRSLPPSGKAGPHIRVRGSNREVPAKGRRQDRGNGEGTKPAKVA